MCSTYVCVLVYETRTINAYGTAKRACVFISRIHRPVGIKFLLKIYIKNVSFPV
jgi:hypothetical protein